MSCQVSPRQPYCNERQSTRVGRSIEEEVVLTIVVLNHVVNTLVVVDQFTPTLNFLEDLLFFIEKMFTTS